MTAIQNLFASAFHLFYPHTCSGCGSDLLGEKDFLCIRCIESLPHTGFEKYPHNPVERIFHGRINIVAAAGGFYFNKGGIVQHLIHELKYKGNKQAGLYLSRLMGEQMFQSRRFADIDFLVPLPLFAEKEFKRGFNQAETVCNGLSEAMNIPVLTKNVVRVKQTETQTKKHRAERWENVSESFHVNEPAVLSGKHILLVDDVITTGATLEACAQVISTCGSVRISITALAVAK